MHTSTCLVWEIRKNHCHKPSLQFQNLRYPEVIMINSWKYCNEVEGLYVLLSKRQIANFFILINWQFSCILFVCSWLTATFFLYILHAMIIIYFRALHRTIIHLLKLIKFSMLIEHI
jgi:hypothetical protein